MSKSLPAYVKNQRAELDSLSDAKTISVFMPVLIASLLADFYCYYNHFGLLNYPDYLPNAQLYTACDIISLVFLALISLRICFLSFKYSRSIASRLQVSLLSFFVLIPVAFGFPSLLRWCGLEIGRCVDKLVYAMNSAWNVQALDFYSMVNNTGFLVLIFVSIIFFALWLRNTLFPVIYLKKNATGVSLGLSTWNQVLGELKIRWDEIERVWIKDGGGKCLLLRFAGRTYNIPWDVLSKNCDPIELMNELKTYAPDVLDISCLQGETKTAESQYTELWLKYFSNATERTRTSVLQSGERLNGGRYEVAGELGQGGQGTAYLAQKAEENAEDKGVTIVLKEYILPVHRGEAVFQQCLKKLNNEAELLRKIDHPNIVGIKDSFVEDHRGYLVLEYVEGKTLKELVQQEGPQRESFVIEIAMQVCDLMQYLHSMNPPVIHRDLTPDNLILQADGKVKLVDFNVAHQLESSATATVVGKHAYIPPEQFRGRPTQQSDVFALGCTMQFLLSAKEPEPMSVSHPQLHNPRVSTRMDEIVARATQLDQAVRYLSAGELREDLQRMKLELCESEKQL